MASTWKDDEKMAITAIVENLDILELKEITRLYNIQCELNGWPSRTLESVRNRVVRKMGVTIHSTKWLKAETQQLRELHETTKDLNKVTQRLSEAAKASNWCVRAKESVRLRCNALKLELDRDIAWSDEENEFVRKHAIDFKKSPDQVHRAYTVMARNNGWEERTAGAIKHRCFSVRNNIEKTPKWTDKEIEDLLGKMRKHQRIDIVVKKYNSTAGRKNWPKRTRHHIEIELRKRGIKTPKMPNWSQDELLALEDFLELYPKCVAMKRYTRRAIREKWPERTEYAICRKIDSYFSGREFHREDNFTVLDIAKLFQFPHYRVKDWYLKDGLPHEKFPVRQRTKGSKQSYRCVIKKRDLKEFLINNLHKVHDADYDSLEWVVGEFFATQAIEKGQKHGPIEVVKIDLTGKEIARYASISEAARQNYVSMDCLRSMVHDNRSLDGCNYVKADDYDEVLAV